MFGYGLEDQASIPGWVIRKTQKKVLDIALLKTQHYKIWIKSKWSNPGKGVAPSPTPQCSSYWKESLLVALDYGCQFYFYYLVIKWKNSNFDFFHLSTFDVLVKSKLPQVEVKALDCEIVVCAFELHSPYYVNFWINILGTCMNLLILPFMG